MDDFEARYGRADRIDAALFGELQHLELRFAATATAPAVRPRAKVNKFVRPLGEIIDVTVALASEKALELFTRRRSRARSSTRGRC